MYDSLLLASLLSVPGHLKWCNITMQGKSLSAKCTIENVIIDSASYKVAWFIRLHYYRVLQSHNLTRGWVNDNIFYCATAMAMQISRCKFSRPFWDRGLNYREFCSKNTLFWGFAILLDKCITAQWSDSIGRGWQNCSNRFSLLQCTMVRFICQGWQHCSNRLSLLGRLGQDFALLMHVWEDKICLKKLINTVTYSKASKKKLDMRKWQK